MSGGFVPPADSDSPVVTLVNGQEGGSGGESHSAPLLALTPRQEARLRTHLDERLLQLERDERKHAFGSLALLITRLIPILSLILQIPPGEPWGGLRVSYLLTLTGAITGYLTSLPLISGRRGTDTGVDTGSNEAGRTMRQLLDFLELVDIAWQAVLRGDAWVPPLRPGGKGHAVRVDFGASVGATERIRLRSIIISGREKVLAWARIYGHFTTSTFPPSADTASHAIAAPPTEENETDGWEWETEVVGMWNGTLEMLADLDFATDGPS